MHTPTPRRLSLLRNTVVGGCAGILAVSNAVDGRWWWFALAVVVLAWAVTDLVRTARRPEVDEAAVAEAAAEAAAIAYWTVDELRDLRAIHGVDTSTSTGKIRLIKVLRGADPRLGLAAAKNLVDTLDGVPRGGSADPS